MYLHGLNIIQHIYFNQCAETFAWQKKKLREKNVVTIIYIFLRELNNNFKKQKKNEPKISGFAPATPTLGSGINKSIKNKTCITGFPFPFLDFPFFGFPDLFGLGMT